jgi:hypothetical protein
MACMHAMEPTHHSVGIEVPCMVNKRDNTKQHAAPTSMPLPFGFPPFLPARSCWLPSGLVLPPPAHTQAADQICHTRLSGLCAANNGFHYLNSIKAVPDIGKRSQDRRTVISSSICDGKTHVRCPHLLVHPALLGSHGPGQT